MPCGIHENGIPKEAAEEQRSSVTKPMMTDGIASITSGTVTTLGDSCGSAMAVVVPVMVIMAWSVIRALPARLAMKHEEVHPERIERRDEHAESAAQ